MEDTLNQHTIGKRKVNEESSQSEDRSFLCSTDVKKQKAKEEFSQPGEAHSAASAIEELLSESKKAHSTAKNPIPPSIEKWLFGLEGITDIKKQKLEHKLLIYYQKKFQAKTVIRDDDLKKLKKIERDYFCLVQDSTGLSTQYLAEKISRLRKELTNFEDEYVDLLQTNSATSELDIVLQNTVRSRKELMNAEKLYFFLRRRHLHPKRSSDVDQTYSDEALLKNILILKQQLIELEDKYVNLVRDGIPKFTYSSGPNSPAYYEDHVLLRAVNSRREFLMLEEEYSNFVEAISNSYDTLSDFVQELLGRLLYWNSDVAWWEELYPADFEYDIGDIDSKIDLLKRIVPMRKELLRLEEEYLCRVQRRLASSFDTKHFSLVFEHGLEIMLRWGQDLRIAEIAICRQIEKGYPQNISSTNPKQKEDWEHIETELKKVEEKYFQLVRGSYVTTHNSVSTSMDVDQIYSKHLEVYSKFGIVVSRRELLRWEDELDSFIRQMPPDLNDMTRRLHRIADARRSLRSVEDRYLSRFENRKGMFADEIGTGFGTQMNVPQDKTPIFTPVFKSSYNNEEEQELIYLTVLYNSIKTCNFYCLRCAYCISKVIQCAVKLEDKGSEALILYPKTSNLSFDDEVYHQVLHKFLISRDLHCPDCLTYISKVTIQRRPIESENVSPTLPRTPTSENMSVTVTQTPTSHLNEGNYNNENTVVHIETAQPVEREIEHNATNSSSTPPRVETNTIVAPSSEATITLNLTLAEVKQREIMKSIVYGGLNELIQSFRIVASAAAINLATTKAIAAISFSYMIGRAFAISYNISELYAKKPETRPETEAGERVNEYEELLGDRKNYCLHFTVAILSFLVFGLVPFLVYDFTFCKPEDRFFKILAVIGASVLCITLLAIMRAHVFQRPDNFLGYIKSVGDYILDVGLVLIVASFGGEIIEKIVKQFYGFEDDKTSTLFLPDMGFVNQTWGYI